LLKIGLDPMIRSSGAAGLFSCGNVGPDDGCSGNGLNKATPPCWNAPITEAGCVSVNAGRSGACLTPVSVPWAKALVVFATIQSTPATHIVGRVRFRLNSRAMSASKSASKFHYQRISDSLSIDAFIEDSVKAGRQKLFRACVR
jgi:hypothetical protein